MHVSLHKVNTWNRPSVTFESERFLRMFNMTRIPVLSCDRLHQASTADPGSNQILVMIQDHFYLINPYDHNHNFVGVTNIITQLEACVANASSSPKATPLSILTADNRDSWAKVYIITSKVFPSFIDFLFRNRIEVTSYPYRRIIRQIYPK